MATGKTRERQGSASILRAMIDDEEAGCEDEAEGKSDVILERITAAQSIPSGIWCRVCPRRLLVGPSVKSRVAFALFLV
jgi:hypothetical protein